MSAPGRGNLLAGIQGFNKTKLKDTDTKDSSAPQTSSKPSGPGGGGGGGGPFGIPPGGLAGLKKQQSTLAPPPGGPPMPGQARPGGGPPTSTSAPPRMGPPPGGMGGPPPSSNGPPRMGPPPGGGMGGPPPASTPTAGGPPRMGPPPGGMGGPPPASTPTANGPPRNGPPPGFKPPMPGQAPPPTSTPTAGQRLGPPPGFKPPMPGQAPPPTSTPPTATTPGGSRPCITTPVKKESASKSFFALGEHLIDYLIANGLNTPNLFRDKGYKPQVDTLFSFASPGNTFSHGSYGIHLQSILPQLTSDYLSSFDPLAIAEVLRLWVKEVHVFSAANVTAAIKIAAIPDPTARINGMKDLIESCDTSTQSFVAHLLQLFNLIWAHDSGSKTFLAYTFGPLLFPCEQMTLESANQIKKINQMVEEILTNATTVCANGFKILQSNQY